MEVHREPEAPTTVSRYSVRLVKEHFPHPRVRLVEPSRAAEFLHEQGFSSYDREVAGVLLLDVRGNLLGYSLISIGILNATFITPRHVYLPALLSNASGVMLFHSHVHGYTVPSENDLKITRNVAKAGRVLGIPLMDHLILGNAPTYCSLREGGYEGFLDVVEADE